jgi:general stress protein 26
MEDLKNNQQEQNMNTTQNDGENLMHEAQEAQEAQVDQSEVAEVAEQTPVAGTSDEPEVLTPEEIEKQKQQERMAAIERVKAIMDKTRVAFLTTLSGKQLVSRPMYVQGKEFDGTLWFFTRRDSPKVEEIRKDSRVNVLFTEKSHVSLSGRAEIVENDLKKKVYWDKTEEKFFETTYEDPEIVMIKIDALSAEFWDSVSRMPSVFKTVIPLTEDISKTVEF